MPALLIYMRPVPHTEREYSEQRVEVFRAEQLAGREVGRYSGDLTSNGFVNAMSESPPECSVSNG